MDILFVARESADVQPTRTEITDPADALALLARLPHGAQVAPLVSRLALGAMVLGKSLDRQAARAALGVALQRTRARAAVLLGHDLGRELLGEGLSLSGGIRDMHSRPVAALGQARMSELERILVDLCARAHITWAPPSARAATARSVVRAEEAMATAALLIEKQRWAEAAEALREAEPLGPRGTNMLGRCLLMLGDREGARRAFERTLAADPANAIAQRQIASLGG